MLYLIRARAVGLAVPGACAAAQAADGEQWEYTMSLQAQGVPMPLGTIKSCRVPATSLRPGLGELQARELQAQWRHGQLSRRVRLAAALGHERRNDTHRRHHERHLAHQSSSRAASGATECPVRAAFRRLRSFLGGPGDGYGHAARGGVWSCS